MDKYSFCLPACRYGCFTDGAIGCQLQHSVVIRSGNIQVNIIIPGDKPFVTHCAQSSAAAGKVSDVVLFKKSSTWKRMSRSKDCISSVGMGFILFLPLQFATVPAVFLRQPALCSHKWRLRRSDSDQFAGLPVSVRVLPSERSTAAKVVVFPLGQIPGVVKYRCV